MRVRGAGTPSREGSLLQTGCRLPALPFTPGVPLGSWRSQHWLLGVLGCLVNLEGVERTRAPVPRLCV